MAMSYKIGSWYRTTMTRIMEWLTSWFHYTIHSLSSGMIWIVNILLKKNVLTLKNHFPFSSNSFGVASLYSDCNLYHLEYYVHISTSKPVKCHAFSVRILLSSANSCSHYICCNANFSRFFSPRNKKIDVFPCWN